MTTTVLVALVGVLGLVLVAALSYVFSKKQQLESQWRESKLTHYRELLSAISDLAVDNSDDDAHRRFAAAVNTIALVGPQVVVEALLNFHHGVGRNNPGRSDELHDQLLTRLVLEIRRDLEMRPKDNPQTFSYRLAGAPPKKPGTRRVP